MPTINIIKSNPEFLDVETMANNAYSNSLFSALLMQLTAGITAQTSKLDSPRALIGANTEQPTGLNENILPNGKDISNQTTDPSKNIDTQKISVDTNLAQAGWKNENILPNGKDISNQTTDPSKNIDTQKVSVDTNLAQAGWKNENFLQTGKNISNSQNQPAVEIGTKENLKVQRNGIIQIPPSVQTTVIHEFQGTQQSVVSKLPLFDRISQVTHIENVADEAQMIAKFSSSVIQRNIAQALKAINSLDLTVNVPLAATTIKQTIPTEKSEVQIQEETSVESVLKNIEKQFPDPATTKTESTDKSRNNQPVPEKTVILQGESHSSQGGTPKSNLLSSGNLQPLPDNQLVGKKFTDVVPQVPLSAITQKDADNIIKNIVLHCKNEISEMKMKLHPENLGELNLKVRLEESKATVKIEVTQTAVKTIIDSHIPQLRDSLIARGIDVQQIDVFTSGNSASFNHHKKENNNPNNPALFNEQAEETEESIRMLGYNTVEYLI